MFINSVAHICSTWNDIVLALSIFKIIEAVHFSNHAVFPEAGVGDEEGAGYVHCCSYGLNAVALDEANQVHRRLFLSSSPMPSFPRSPTTHASTCCASLSLSLNTRSSALVLQIVHCHNDADDAGESKTVFATVIAQRVSK